MTIVDLPDAETPVATASAVLAAYCKSLGLQVATHEVSVRSQPRDLRKRLRLGAFPGLADRGSSPSRHARSNNQHLIVAAHGRRTASLLARLAALKRAPMMEDCRFLCLDADGHITLTDTAFGGAALRSVSLAHTQIAFATISEAALADVQFRSHTDRLTATRHGATGSFGAAVPAWRQEALWSPNFDESDRLALRHALGGTPSSGSEAIQLMTTRNSHCLYCKSPTRAIVGQEVDSQSGSSHYGYETRRLWICDKCGWWCISSVERIPTDEGTIAYIGHAESALRSGLAQAPTAAITELGAALAKNWEARYSLSSDKMEQLVASVFRNTGCVAEVVGRSGDGGIDIIVGGFTGGQFAVQVKRSANVIAVNSIRDFLGALVIEGHSRGVFVTTSRFSSASTVAAERARGRGLPIVLWDAPRLLSALHVSRAQSSLTPNDPLAPFGDFWHGYKPCPRIGRMYPYFL